MTQNNASFVKCKDDGSTSKCGESCTYNCAYNVIGQFKFREALFESLAD
ncbi:MAG: hypothetical protein MJ164_02185 [Alphaproteobacteria bacterium]|nr:hypothetical protein [Alphaproteobacteria bacterium]